MQSIKLSAANRLRQKAAQRPDGDELLAVMMKHFQRAALLEIRAKTAPRARDQLAALIRERRQLEAALRIANELLGEDLAVGI